MNIYVQFTNDHPGFLNLRPDDESLPFYYFMLDSNELVEHNINFRTYVSNVVNSKDKIYYLFTTASTPDELYSMHPELRI